MTFPRRRPLPALLAALALGAAVPALASTAVAPPEGRAPLEIVPPRAEAPPAGVSMRRTESALPGSGSRLLTLDFAAGETLDAPAGTEGGKAQRWFDGMLHWLGSVYDSLTSGLTPPSPEAFTKRFKSKDPYDFWQLVGDAGYKLKEISTDVGVVPDVGFKFRYVRELSDGDINWLERKLRKHEEKFHDPLSFAQRAIIYTLLSINSSDVYFVQELNVKFLPLPTARFILTTWDSGLSWENDILLRAIKGQKHEKRKPTEEDAHY
jgi:hypothetical protein